MLDLSFFVVKTLLKDLSESLKDLSSKLPTTGGEKPNESNLLNYPNVDFYRSKCHQKEQHC